MTSYRHGKVGIATIIIGITADIELVVLSDSNGKSVGWRYAANGRGSRIGGKGKGVGAAIIKGNTIRYTTESSNHPVDSII